MLNVIDKLVVKLMKQEQKQNIKTDKAYFLTLTLVNWIDVFIGKSHRDAIFASVNNILSRTFRNIQI